MPARIRYSDENFAKRVLIQSTLEPAARGQREVVVTGTGADHLARACESRRHRNGDAWSLWKDANLDHTRGPGKGTVRDGPVWRACIGGQSDQIWYLHEWQTA